MKNSALASPPVTVSEINPACKHCGKRCHTSLQWNELNFCCHGCLQIYRVFETQGLKDYYDIRARSTPESVRTAAPETDYSYADRFKFLNQYGYGTHRNVIDIYVEGVHCTACLWLLEKLPQYLPNVISARLNLGDGVLTVATNDGKFAGALQQIHAWGYLPRPLKKSSEQRYWRQRDLQRDISRLAVTAFCAGNIMLMSVSIYAGVMGDLRTYFLLFSFYLSIPALTYGAAPLYKSSWAALKRGRISIDLPIVIAMLTAFAMSLWGATTGGETYYDSLSALVFLILASRFFLKHIQQKHLNKTRLQMHFVVGVVLKWEGTKYIEANADSILAGERVLVKQNELIPVDGVITSGEGDMNLAFLTGESAPVQIKIHEPALMGARLISGWAEVTATVDFQESRIQKLLRDLEADAPVASTLRIAEKVGQAFLFMVFTAAAAVIFAWWGTDTQTGFYRALSFIIVACPCTFASVLPLTFGLALKKAAREGIFIKDPSIFERIKKVEKIYFDKTGVLTEGVFEVLTFKWIAPQTARATERIYAAVATSEHPVSRALARYIRFSNPQEINQEQVHTENLPGRGLIARFADGAVLKIEKVDSGDTNEASIPNAVEIRLNDELLVTVALGDRVRDNAASVVRKLQQLGYDCWMLSGDQHSAVNAVARAVGIPSQNALGNLTFEDKQRIVKESPSSIMIGDGNNDALALKASSIGIAMQGGVESALRSSHVYISGGELSSLLSFISTSHLAHKLIFISLAISVAYNAVAGTMALMGLIHPLVAAFVMPLNAITVFAVCLWAFRERPSRWS